MLYRRRRLLLLAQTSPDPNLQSLITALFGNGEQGAFYVPKPQVLDQQVLFQDAVGTTPVTAPGDPVGLMLDVSPNGNHLSQPVSGSRPVLVQDGDNYHLKLDKVDDNLSVTFAEPITGTMLLATRDGIVHADVDIPAGEWSITADPRYYPGDTLVGLILRDGHMNEQELQAAREYLISIGAGADQFAGVTSMAHWLRGLEHATAFHVEDWDTSSVGIFTALVYSLRNLSKLDVSSWNTSSATSFYAFANGARSLTTLDLSNWDTSSVTSFWGFAIGAHSLHTVIVNGGTGNPFADSPCTNYSGAFSNTNLSQQSIDDILVAIEKAGTSNGTFDQSGGSTPSAVGEAAIDALRARGWTVTVTGGY